MIIRKIIAFVLLLAGLSIAFYFLSNNIPSNDIEFSNVIATSSDDISSNPFKIVKDGVSDIFDGNNMDVLVFGLPGDGYNASNLSDVIMLMHYNQKKNELSLISIPRDLWVSDSGVKFKFNEVVERDKINFAMSTVGHITGYTPSGYMIVNLSMVKDVVDWLGGVDITLDAPAVDWVSGYTLTEGVHHLDGEDSVWLIRNRYNKNGDFFRESNQHKIIKSVFEKIEKLSISEKVSFFNSFIINSNMLENLDFDVSKIIPLVINGKMNNLKINSVIVDPDTKLFDITWTSLSDSSSTRVSIVAPSAGFGNYDKIREYIQDRTK